MAYRLEKVNELIKRELGKILLEEGNFGSGVFVTILDVETSVDLRQAGVTFSVLPTAKGDKLLVNLNARVPFFQQLLNKKLKMRPVPKIRFVLDKTEAEGQKIETLLRNLKKSEKYEE